MNRKNIKQLKEFLLLYLNLSITFFKKNIKILIILFSIIFIILSFKIFFVVWDYYINPEKRIVEKILMETKEVYVSSHDCNMISEEIKDSMYVEKGNIVAYNAILYEKKPTVEVGLKVQTNYDLMVYPKQCYFVRYGDIYLRGDGVRYNISNGIAGYNNFLHADPKYSLSLHAKRLYDNLTKYEYREITTSYAPNEQFYQGQHVEFNNGKSQHGILSAIFVKGFKTFYLVDTRKNAFIVENITQIK